MRQGFPYGCPRCGQIDHVTRVQAMVQDRADDTVRMLGTDAPPRPPGGVRNPGVILISVGWVVPSMVLAAVSGTGPLGFLVILCVAPIGFGIYHFFGRHTHLLRIRFRQEEYERHRRQYDEIMELWLQLEYCGRCHGVFLPGHEWQAAVNPAGDLVPAGNAWGYCVQLMRHAWSRQRRTVVDDTTRLPAEG